MIFGCLLFGSDAYAVNYHVGPLQNYSTIGEVPWEALNPGDAVYIHWRPTPYREKWVIGRSGVEGSPILVSGVPGPNGELPVISGDNATTRQALNYTNEERGLIKIGSSNVPADTLPQYIIIENLNLRSARPPYTFNDDSGHVQTYSSNGSSIYVEKARHLTIRNCTVQDSGNGIFIGAFAGQTQDILIEKNRIFDNGIVGSYYQHNTYTAAIGITYQYNYMGALRSGAGGNNLKDRSAGLVVRYNWIENGNRQLDLVDAEDSSVLVQHPLYHSTYVYGNILLEAEGEGNSQMVHYGGDSGTTSDYRKGVLYFYNNTLISTRSSNTTVLRLSTNDETADFFNNIVYVTAEGSRLALMAESGTLKLSHNWVKSGFRLSHSAFAGSLVDDGTSISGDAPGFIDFAAGDYHLLNSSVARDVGRSPDPAVLPGNLPIYQYVPHLLAEERGDDGNIDIGAFEYQSLGTGGPGDMGLEDVISVLQIVSGQVPAKDQAGTDIDGDLKIGLQEAIFCLNNLRDSE